jgi:hypothetical protein
MLRLKVEVDKLEDAPQQVVVLEQKQLHNNSDVLSLEKELFALGNWVFAFVLCLAHAKVQDGEG